MFNDYSSFFPYIFLFLCVAGVLIFVGIKIPSKFFQDGEKNALGSFFGRIILWIWQVIRAMRPAWFRARLAGSMAEMRKYFFARTPKEILGETFEKNSERKMNWQNLLMTEGRVLQKPIVSPLPQTKLAQTLQNHSAKRSEGKSASEEDFWIGVLRQNPRNPHPYKRLGEIYMNRGEYDEAGAALAYAVSRNPGDEEASRLLNDARKALANQNTNLPA